MSPRKTKYKPKPFESIGGSSDTSANIYHSMLTHPAFMALKTRQKVLYLYCKAQYYGKRKPGKDFPDVKALQSEDCFYMNLSLAVSYGLYTRNGNKEFYADMKELCEVGFLEMVANGKNTQSRSIYRFSEKWSL